MKEHKELFATRRSYLLCVLIVAFLLVICYYLFSFYFEFGSVEKYILSGSLISLLIAFYLISFARLTRSGLHWVAIPLSLILGLSFFFISPYIFVFPQYDLYNKKVVDYAVSLDADFFGNPINHSGIDLDLEKQKLEEKVLLSRLMIVFFTPVISAIPFCFKR